jgi:Ni/Co efflux regulator RcnB
MLKTISAALLAVTVIAAPAMAAGTAKTAHARDVKAMHIKPSVRNAHAEMGRHHHHYRHFHHHYRFHRG